MILLSAKGSLSMREQFALLFEDCGEWIFIADDGDDPERMWKSFDAAVAELQQDGWQIVEGPGLIKPPVDGFERFVRQGYRLRRGIQ
jgi:hypothetical protein